jgi:hypothetical protein
MIARPDWESKVWSVQRVSSGNFLEMYDFTVFGYYAAAIGRAFFPSGSPFVSLMTFGTGFLLGVMLRAKLPPEKMTAWGWRVPLFLGCVLHAPWHGLMAGDRVMDQAS